MVRLQHLSIVFCLVATCGFSSLGQPLSADSLGQTGRIFSPLGNAQQAGAVGSEFIWLNQLTQSFPRYRSFLGQASTTFTGSWVKPVGATLAMIEAWGGGGGGGSRTAGGGGAYAMTVIDITQVNQLDFSIGQGGTSALVAGGTDGGTTTVSWQEGATTRTITAPGGRTGATGSNGGLGASSGFSNLPTSVTFLGLPGVSGAPRRRFFAQNGNSSYRTIIEGGRGGGVFRFPQVGGYGHNAIVDVIAGTTVYAENRPQPASYPGGGGGTSHPTTTNNQNNGAPGMVIIRWL